ncbi:MAG TPA: class I SAM-dependent methyltransferase [Coleofasciculaceae cyanobacterium]|jgi:SAM-dependent methyltransferase
MNIKRFEDDNRTLQQIKEHYKIEKELATKLRNSRKEERQYLYNALYDELFKQVPSHPQINRKADPVASAKEVSRKMRLLIKYLKPDSIFLEVGPGDCCLSFEVAKWVKKVYAVDVSPEIVQHSAYPKNSKLIISDGCSIPLSQNTITIAYSNQLMEHLHPDDALEQLHNIYQSITPGGVYICITPNRLCGPHDVSKYFDEEATGFHLKEYTQTELSDLFYQVGFSKLIAYIGGKGIYLRFPLFIIKIIENILKSIPFKLRNKLGNFLPIRALLGVILVGQK